ncbi:O-antigen ligase family protein [Capnocytophaga canimorsus]|uniref:O-antigen ligase family protein n=1 Tax=Capnocytophaga canimorsus TaxID=28188 RepID=UPI001EDFCD13|nr:O-antigen ligase family protein [Capnocytophaga canimorsus]GJQ03944.1 polysaccharide polymerase [Capnocytophaga canimorsus]
MIERNKYRGIGNITEWLFVLLCFCYPISAVLSLFLSIDSTLFNTGYRALALLFSVFVLLKLPYVKKENNIAIHLLFIFFLFYLFRIFYDIGFKGMEVAYFRLFSFYIGNIVLPIFTLVKAFKFIDIQRLLRRIFKTLIIANILILFAFFYQQNFSFSPEVLLGRAEVKIGEKDSLVNSITYSLYGGYLFLLCFSLLVFQIKNISKNKIRLFFFLFLGIINLLLGSSRGPLLSTFLAIVVFLLQYFLYVKKKNIFKLGLIVVLVSIVISYSFTYLNENNFQLGIIERMLKFSDDMHYGEKEGRISLYGKAFDFFEESPILGKQFMFDNGAYPHNMVLEVLMALGLIGFLLYLSVILFYLKRIFDIYRIGKFYVPIVFISVLSFGLTMTTGNIYENVEFWNIMAFVLLVPLKHKK